MIRQIFSTRTVLFAIAAAYSATLVAQTPLPRTVARLKDVQGTVLVSQGDAMVAGINEQRMRPDTRVVTTSSAAVTVVYDRGCEVRLTENERFIVREYGDCPALIASVEGLGGAAVAGGATAGLAAAGPGLSLGGALVIGGVVYLIATDRNNNVSPN